MLVFEDRMDGCTLRRLALYLYYTKWIFIIFAFYYRGSIVSTRTFTVNIAWIWIT